MAARQIYEDIVHREIEKAMDVMFPYGAGKATHTHVRHWLDKIGQMAFSQGGDYALMSLLTVDDVAELFGISKRRARALAKNRIKKSVVLLVQRADQLYYITVRL